MSRDEMRDMVGECADAMESMGGMMHGAGATDMGGMGMMGTGPMMGMNGGVVLLGVVVLFLVLIAVAVVLVVVLTRRQPSGNATGENSALHELDRRYARGEVERDTYLEIRRDLREASG